MSKQNKMFTGILGRYMKDHEVRNNMWDKSQMGTCNNVLGTTNQLLIDQCILGELKEHHKNLAVAYHDYQKAYDKIKHDWMIRVYNWIGLPQEVIGIISNLMSKWRTRLEINRDGKKENSRWINIKRNFLQGDSYSPVGFCCTEIPAAMLLEETKGYSIGNPGERDTKRTHSLFIDDLMVCKENHEELKKANEVIVKASSDIGAMYGVNKCAEIVCKRGKMVKVEGQMYWKRE